ncbi:MAG: hypothetical protein JNK76_10130 [Planctomycetales bacterium]|nr:hypothetical protein [Planctomycetales bacterium]MBN8626668.1 hypothetical protein [Planctomycetota bacterium]
MAEDQSSAASEKLAPAGRLRRRLSWGFALLLAVYVAAYAGFYIRGVAEADARGDDAIYFDADRAINARQGFTRQHELLLQIFEPLHWIHTQYFGGRYAYSCDLRLSRTICRDESGRIKL